MTNLQKMQGLLNAGIDLEKFYCITFSCTGIALQGYHNSDFIQELQKEGGWEFTVADTGYVEAVKSIKFFCITDETEQGTNPRNYEKVKITLT